MCCVNQKILGDGNYKLLTELKYDSPRYNKSVIIPAGRISDGATGAFDVTSIGWWVHDELCMFGQWSDGTKISNWTCSQVLQDILKSEGRWLQSKYWFWGTFFFGGGKARKNGFFKVKEKK